MSNESTAVERIEAESTDVEPIGEWYLLEDGEGTIVQCTDTLENKRAVLHEDFGTKYVVPLSFLGTSIPRVRGRNDARPPTDC